MGEGTPSLGRDVTLNPLRTGAARINILSRFLDDLGHPRKASAEAARLTRAAGSVGPDRLDSSEVQRSKTLRTRSWQLQLCLG